MFMCMLEINNYPGLVFSLGGDRICTVVKTVTDGSRARHGRPRLGL